MNDEAFGTPPGEAIGIQLLDTHFFDEQPFSKVAACKMYHDAGPSQQLDHPDRIAGTARASDTNDDASFHVLIGLGHHGVLRWRGDVSACVFDVGRCPDAGL